MRLLIDTHLLLWAAASSARLSPRAQALMTDSGNDLFFSAASIWEIAIKTARGKHDFDVDPRAFRQRLLAQDYDELPVFGEHAERIGSVNMVRKDPFDRLLLSQAVAEDLTLLTSDGMLARYPGPILKV